MNSHSISITNIARFCLLCLVYSALTVNCCQSRWSKPAQPELELAPLSPDDTHLIWYKSGPGKSSESWVNALDKFLGPYNTATTSENAQNCDNRVKPDKNKFCDFKLSNKFAPCTKEFGYGFGSKEEGGPCIFLKPSKVLGWEPVYYTNHTIPRDMPIDLKWRIIDAYNRMRWGQGQHHTVWLICEGETPTDIENLGPINYHPQQGFSEKYFPFTNVKGYLSPLVAVHFEKPARGILISVKCTMWAQNINHDGENGSVHFELMIDYN